MKICSKCNIEKPKTEFYKKSAAKDGLGGCCKSCEAEIGKAWREANKERKAAQVKAWREANKERLATYNKEWQELNKDRLAEYREANKERLAEKCKAWREANKERIAEYREANKDRIAATGMSWNKANKDRKATTGKEWYEANKERAAEKSRSWNEANPEKLTANWRNRRARKRNSEGTHTAADIKTIFTNQRGLCAACQIKLVKSGKNKYHVDHIMPLALGGSNWPANLQCLCPSCNRSKGAKHPDEWAKLNGKLL